MYSSISELLEAHGYQPTVISPYGLKASTIRSDGVSAYSKQNIAEPSIYIYSEDWIGLSVESFEKKALEKGWIEKETKVRTKSIDTEAASAPPPLYPFGEKEVVERYYPGYSGEWPPCLASGSRIHTPKMQLSYANGDVIDAMVFCAACSYILPAIDLQTTITLGIVLTEGENKPECRHVLAFEGPTRGTERTTIGNTLCVKCGVRGFGSFTHTG